MQTCHNRLKGHVSRVLTLGYALTLSHNSCNVCQYVEPFWSIKFPLTENLFLMNRSCLPKNKKIILKNWIIKLKNIFTFYKHNFNLSDQFKNFKFFIWSGLVFRQFFKKLILLSSKLMWKKDVYLKFLFAFISVCKSLERGLRIKATL